MFGALQALHPDSKDPSQGSPRYRPTLCSLPSPVADLHFVSETSNRDAYTKLGQRALKGIPLYNNTTTAANLPETCQERF